VGLSALPIVSEPTEEQAMNREKRQTKPKKPIKAERSTKSKVVEALTAEAEDKSIKEEGDPLGANFA